MKTTTFTFLLLLSCSQWLVAQCPTDITFSTQAQIDSFKINYPGCTEIPGKVEISGSDITELSGLNEIKSVRSLNIHDNPVLVSLNGLNNLVEVEGTWAPTGCGVRIANNPTLPNLKGLDSLSNVQAQFSIYNNMALETLEGLELLESVGYCVVPHSSAHGGLGIENNPVLTSLHALENFSEGDIGIYGNPSLESLEGLNNIEHGSLSISENAALENLAGLEDLDSLFGSLFIGYNENLASFSGLENLQYIQGGFTVTSNPLLTNFNGLDKLAFIGSDCFAVICFGLYITDNAALESLYGLDSLLSIEGSLIINSNDSLQSLCGLNKDLSINEGIYINHNTALFSCHVEAMCNKLSNFPNNVFISENASGCLSPDEVQTACTTAFENCVLTIEKVILEESKQLIIFPNPTTDLLYLQLPESITQPTDISLFDAQVRLVERQSFLPGQTVRLGHLPSGLYTLKVTDGERVFAGKFIKQ